MLVTLILNKQCQYQKELTIERHYWLNYLVLFIDRYLDFFFVDFFIFFLKNILIT